MEILGGMGKFVSKQAKVGLLINSPWEHPGSFVKPEITLAVIQMCRDAGAKEIGVFVSFGDSYSRRSALSEKFRDEVKSIRSLEDGYKEVSVPGGRALKQAEIAKGLLECDVFINIPIAKDHTGARGYETGEAKITAGYGLPAYSEWVNLGGFLLPQE